MEWKRLKIESQSEWCDGGVDRISQLPDDIIVSQILSRLDLSMAAITGVLSSRWCDLWRYTTSLDFFDNASAYRSLYGIRSWDGDMVKYIALVNSIVEKHKARSLKEFRLFNRCLDESSLPAIAKWLEFAFSRRVEELKLDLDSQRLWSGPLVFEDLLRLLPTNLLKSSDLRSLCVESLSVSGEAIKLILRDCHLLEQLMLTGLDFTSDIEVCSLVLKCLEMNYVAHSCGKSIKVSAPNLTFLKISGESLFQIENVPKLVELHLNFALGGPGFADLQKCCPIFHQLQILTISLFKPMDFLAIPANTMCKLMELEVTYSGGSKYLLPLLNSFIRASPLLQTFNFKFLKSNDVVEEGDIEAVNVEAFKHCNLRVFMCSVFNVYHARHMKLLSYILDKCAALGKLCIEVYKTNQQRHCFTDRVAIIERDMLLLQPKIPAHIQLQVI